jgi:HSP20 family protein
MNTLIPMTRLLDAAFNSALESVNDRSDRALHQVPRADILEGESEFMIVMDMPGVETEHLDINLEDQTLTVKADRAFAAQEGYQALRKELPSKVSFQRSFNLSKNVANDKIAAKLDGGVLKITLPKSETSLPRRIDVK